MKSNINFEEAVREYKKNLLAHKIFTKDSLRLETHVESLRDWSELISLKDLKKLFLKKQKKNKMFIKKINLADTKNWIIHKKTGNIYHSSNNFFSIKGVRVSGTITREVAGKGWDQPLIVEKNNVGGILGIIRKKINKIPYYLVDFKAEPGNPDKIQISPCIQATYSNINQSHGGRKPFFSDLFLNPNKYGYKILFEQLMSEDGGRLYKKKNKGMLIECNKKNNIDLKDNFFWLSLYQIKYLIKKNSWVNPHVRSIISHL
jgi:dTDP-4-dehydro-6-deoxy-alpha-D-glucopyranose 2,3-dehydratase